MASSGRIVSRGLPTWRARTPSRAATEGWRNRLACSNPASSKFSEMLHYRSFRRIVSHGPGDIGPWDSDGLGVANGLHRQKKELIQVLCNGSVSGQVRLLVDASAGKHRGCFLSLILHWRLGEKTRGGGGGRCLQLAVCYLDIQRGLTIPAHQSTLFRLVCASLG